MLHSRLNFVISSEDGRGDNFPYHTTNKLNHTYTQYTTLSIVYTHSACVEVCTTVPTNGESRGIIVIYHVK